MTFFLILRFLGKKAITAPRGLLYKLGKLVLKTSLGRCWVQKTSVWAPKIAVRTLICPKTLESVQREIYVYNICTLPMYLGSGKSGMFSYHCFDGHLKNRSSGCGSKDSPSQLRMCDLVHLGAHARNKPKLTNELLLEHNVHCDMPGQIPYMSWLILIMPLSTYMLNCAISLGREWPGSCFTATGLLSTYGALWTHWCRASTHSSPYFDVKIRRNKYYTDVQVST